MLATVTYSTADYSKARKYNVKMALKRGKVDKVFECDENDISEEFYNKNAKVLDCKRGAGYWLWKPYIVNKTLDELAEGDYLFYCDSGAFLTKDLRPIVQFMEEQETDILFFELDCVERNWTKRDIFIELACDTPEYADTPQRCATYFLIKKTKKSVVFMQKWLETACCYELISDEDNVLHKKENYDGFVDNRHDQSILSILSKKYGYKAYTDISQYRYPRGLRVRIAAKKNKKEHAPYPILLCIHRQKKADITSMFRESVLNYFPKLAKYLHFGYH